MENPKYLSPEDIAERYSIKADTVRKWIREGKLRAAKIGRVWRVEETDLDNFIKFNKNK